MSRHFYKTEYQGKPVTVTMGYDRPLAGFFMVIEDDDELDDEYIFSNLNEEIPHPKSLKRYRIKLEQLGICAPEEMLLEVEADGAARMGNKDVYHSIVNGTHHRAVRV